MPHNISSTIVCVKKIIVDPEEFQSSGSVLYGTIMVDTCIIHLSKSTECTIPKWVLIKTMDCGYNDTTMKVHQLQERCHFGERYWQWGRLCMYRGMGYMGTLYFLLEYAVSLRWL